jgi:cold shock protein
MATGVVKSYNANKGYGFIKPDDGGTDVFVHANSLRRANIMWLNVGDKVSYEVVNNKGKSAAESLRIL